YPGEEFKSNNKASFPLTVYTETEVNCFDSKDNDADGLIDVDDPECGLAPHIVFIDQILAGIIAPISVQPDRAANLGFVAVQVLIPDRTFALERLTEVQRRELGLRLDGDVSIERAEGESALAQLLEEPETRNELLALLLLLISSLIAMVAYKKSFFYIITGEKRNKKR
ncbi:MAG TPA: hypothetical protein VJK05_02465, partial [archaeon]|nr:hypothetical protein [archaeon]